MQDARLSSLPWLPMGKGGGGATIPRGLDDPKYLKYGTFKGVKCERARDQPTGLF